MQSTPGDTYPLKQRINDAEQSSDVIAVLEELAPLLLEHADSREYYTVLVDIFQALRVLTAERSDEGEYFILRYLLDFLEMDSEGTAIQQYATMQLRECLEEWMMQYSDQESIALRQRLLDELSIRFQARPSHALCWTFAHIGYRTQHLVDMLWDYARNHDDEEGEVALVTLTALGVPQRERTRLLNVLHKKIRSRVTMPVLTALYRLADARSFRVVRATCFHQDRAAQDTTVLRELSLIFHMLSTIADAHDGDEHLQNEIWRLIVEQYNLDAQHVAYVVNLGGDITSRCDSKDVIPALLTWLGQATTEEVQQQRNPLLPYRLEECIRPRQLAGWQQARTEALPILRRSACQDTRSAGRYATHEMHRKEAAWGTLLRMGYIEALQWFEEAVGQETNPYLRGKLCDLLACFRFNHLPGDVTKTLAERYDANTSDTTGQMAAEIVVRLGAVKIARSTASKQAFTLLLQCRLTLNEQPLLATVEALSDVACSLARQGEKPFVTKRLVEAIVQPFSTASRLAAAKALETLAHEQELAPTLLKPLVDLLLVHDAEDPFLSSILLSTLASQQHISPELLPSIQRWALERDDELALHSFSLLAERGWLLKEPVLLQRLGVANAEEGEVPLLSRSAWRTHIIGLLYLNDPEPFIHEVTDLIQSLPWDSAVQLFGKLKAFLAHDPPRTLPREQVITLLERVRQRQTLIRAELDLIRLTAKLIPEDFVQELWDHYWNDWLPNARAVLADALGQLEEPSKAAEKQQVRLLLLLTGDGQYLVRRAAYRGLQQCVSSLLLQWCWAWALSEERVLRVRAAEAIAWLLAEGVQEQSYVRLFPLLANDPEPEVRQTALRTRQERRKRLWAQEYLRRVMAMLDGSLSNATVLSVWPYAEALKRVGDDMTLQSLRTALENRVLPPHIRHWFQQLFKETNEGWEKAIKKWPQPAHQWMGTLEVGHGVLLTTAAHMIPVAYTIWQENPASLSEPSSWGGMVQGGQVLELLYEESLSLRLEDGRQGGILLKETNGPGGIMVFTGQGIFPQ